MNCNATLTVCATTDDVVATIYQYNPAAFYKAKWNVVIPDGVTTVRDGDRLLRLDRPEHTCILTDHDGRAGHINHDRVDIACERLPGDLPHPTQMHLCKCGLVWHDGVKGATSHADNTPPADVCPDCGGTTNADKFSSGIDRDCPSCGGTGKGRA